MATLKNILLILFVIALSIAGYILYDKFYHIIKYQKEELEYYKTKEVRDSILFRQSIRAEKERLFLYQDSIRELKINLIKEQNAKSRKKTNFSIKRLLTNDDNYRDSIWTDEWQRKDSLPY